MLHFNARRRALWHVSCLWCVDTAHATNILWKKPHDNEQQQQRCVQNWTENEPRWTHLPWNIFAINKKKKKTIIITISHSVAATSHHNQAVDSLLLYCFGFGRCCHIVVVAAIVTDCELYYTRHCTDPKNFIHWISVCRWRWAMIPTGDPQSTTTEPSWAWAEQQQ